MVTVEQLLKALPPLRNKSLYINYEQSTDEIREWVIITHEDFETDYDNIYKLFDTGDIYSTCRELWNFCKYNMRYVVESDKTQTVKSPSAILRSSGVDCKHYALFIGGVLDAIKHNEFEAWDWCYRFAAYNSGKHIEHVFVVVKLKDGTEIWVDPVLRSFNEKKQPTFYIDEKPMALYQISGIGAQGESIEVDKGLAETNFLVMTNLDLFGLKTLMRDNPQIVNTQVRDYYQRNGLDFENLLNILRA